MEGAAAFRGAGGVFGAGVSPGSGGTAPAGGGWSGCWPPGTGTGAGPAAITGGGTRLGGDAVPVICGAAGLCAATAGALGAVLTGGGWLGCETVSRGAAGAVCVIGGAACVAAGAGDAVRTGAGGVPPAGVSMGSGLLGCGGGGGAVRGAGCGGRSTGGAGGGGGATGAGGTGAARAGAGMLGTSTRGGGCTAGIGGITGVVGGASGGSANANAVPPVKADNEITAPEASTTPTLRPRLTQSVALTAVHSPPSSRWQTSAHPGAGDALAASGHTARSASAARHTPVLVIAHWCANPAGRWALPQEVGHGSIVACGGGCRVGRSYVAVMRSRVSPSLPLFREACGGRRRLRHLWPLRQNERLATST